LPAGKVISAQLTTPAAPSTVHKKMLSATHEAHRRDSPAQQINRQKPQNYKKISLRFATSVHHELQILQIVHACGLAKEQLCLIYTETQTEEKNDKTIRRSPFALLHRTMHHELQIL